MSIGKEFKKYAQKEHHIANQALEDYALEAQNMTRSVIEERPGHFREIDVFARLISQGIIYLGGSITSEVSNVVVAQLLFLDSLDSKKDITLYINSPGGGIYGGLAIYDTMQYIHAPVGTICVGIAASMAAVLLAGGAKGKRTSLPHSRIMIHQPLTSMDGQGHVQMSDMEINVKQLLSLGEDLYRILAHHTGQSIEKIRTDANRDFWLRATGAQAYGLIDSVLTKS